MQNRGMKTINGYTVIAHKSVQSGFFGPAGILILGHRARGEEGHEYVVATVDSLSDTSWDSGNYVLDLPTAFRNYDSRS